MLKIISLTVLIISLLATIHNFINNIKGKIKYHWYYIILAFSTSLIPIIYIILN